MPSFDVTPLPCHMLAHSTSSILIIDTMCEVSSSQAGHPTYGGHPISLQPLHFSPCHLLNATATFICCVQYQKTWGPWPIDLPNQDPGVLWPVTQIGQACLCPVGSTECLINQALPSPPPPPVAPSPPPPPPQPPVSSVTVITASPSTSGNGNGSITVSIPILIIALTLTSVRITHFTGSSS